jgi:hypothetical protein
MFAIQQAYFWSMAVKQEKIEGWENGIAIS